MKLMNVYEKVCGCCGVRSWTVQNPETDLVCAVCGNTLPDRVVCLSVNLPDSINDRMVAVDWSSPKEPGQRLRRGETVERCPAQGQAR